MPKPKHDANNATTKNPVKEATAKENHMMKWKKPGFLINLSEGNFVNGKRIHPTEESVTPGPPTTQGAS